MNTNRDLINSLLKIGNLFLGKFKIYKILFSFMMITNPSYAEWVTMNQWPTVTSTTFGSVVSRGSVIVDGEGGIQQVAKFGTYGTYDLSHVNNPYKEFSMYQYESGTTALRYGGSGIISSISGGSKCYIYPIVFAGGTFASDMTGMKSSSSPSGYALSWLGTESVHVVEKPCSTLTVDSNEISLFNSIVTIPSFYLARSWASSSAADEWARLWRPSSYNIPVFSYGFPVKMGYALIACTQPWTSISGSRSYCSQTSLKWGASSNNGEIIVDPVQCSLSGDTLLDFKKVSPSDYHNVTANSNLSISCTKEATVKLTVLGDGKIDLGPFNVKIAFDNDSSSVTKLVNMSLDTKIMGTILSAKENIEPGVYQNSIVIVANIE
ncbi:TPA: hypothetical protein ACS72F_003431 [Providencia alcalifaciens]|nr:hypothetical protein [Providencia alcalifaciens]